jgi:hypothetical protein
MFECISGMPQDAAIFKRIGTNAAGSEVLDLEVFRALLQQNWIDVGLLVQLLDCSGKFLAPKMPQHLHSLKALAAIGDAYKLMPGATINTQIFSKPIGNAIWMPTGSSPSENLTSGHTIERTLTRGSLINGTEINPKLLVVPRPKPYRDSIESMRLLEDTLYQEDYWSKT